MQNPDFKIHTKANPLGYSAAPINFRNISFLYGNTKSRLASLISIITSIKTHCKLFIDLFISVGANLVDFTGFSWKRDGKQQYWVCCAV